MARARRPARCAAARSRSRRGRAAAAPARRAGRRRGGGACRDGRWCRGRGQLVGIEAGGKVRAQSTAGGTYAASAGAGYTGGARPSGVAVRRGEGVRGPVRRRGRGRGRRRDGLASSRNSARPAKISSSSSPVCRATTVALTAAAVTLVAVRAMSAMTPIGIVTATNSSGRPAADITVAAATVAAPGTPATPTETKIARNVRSR